MNGYSTAVLVWIVNVLLGAVSALLVVVVKQHVTSDKEHRERMDEEIKMLRTKVHDLGNRFAGIQLKGIKRDS